MRQWSLALTLIAALFYSPPASSTVPGDAARFIEGLGTRAVALFNQSNLPVEAKEEQVRSLLAENFDLDKIGQFVVGRFWQSMNSDQRTSYLGLFREFVLRSYARNLGGYSGANFVVVGSRPAGQDDVIVLTQINRPEDSRFEAGWRVATEGDEMKIVDVVVSGVSMAMTQRSDFESVLRRDGVNGFIDRLGAQLSALKKRGG